MNRHDITVLIITLDEIDNIGRLLSDLESFPNVLLVDSGSHDGTVECAESYPNVRILSRAFDSFSNQCNAGLAEVSTPWVLSLDADYRVSPQLASEIDAMEPTEPAYWCRFVFAVHGQPLRSTLLPPRAVLFRSSCRYAQDGHAHRLDIDDRNRKVLRNTLTHDDRKPLARWYRAQCGYAQQEAKKLTSCPKLSMPDRIRAWILIAPWLVPLYVLFARGLILDGRRGFHYAMQRMIAESLLSLYLLDDRLRHADR